MLSLELEFNGPEEVARVAIYNLLILSFFLLPG